MVLLCSNGKGAPPLSLLASLLHVIPILLFCIRNSLASSSTLGMLAAASSVAMPGNETDRFSLLAFKAGITRDPTAALSSWNRTLHFCQWRGVVCGRRHRGRVVALQLTALGLQGSVSPFLGNLTFLREISLRNNSLHGVIPPELSRLFRLELLDLRSNLFSGLIASNLTACPHLQIIDLARNRLTGVIPAWLGSIPGLRYLDMNENRLHGAIPPSLGNLSSHVFWGLGLGQNSLAGAIPEALGRLDGLIIFQVDVNQLSGKIPDSLFNKSFLQGLGVSENRLEGVLPPDMGTTLPMLTYFDVHTNLFQGPIPESLSNSTQLSWLILGENGFRGAVPRNLGISSESLTMLNVFRNQLEATDASGWEFMTSMANCTRLQALSISHNLFQGRLPSSVVNLSKSLNYLTMGDNQITGRIPEGIENLISLQTLEMGHNSFVGNIPASLGKLHDLGKLELFSNKLSGEIPSALGNLTRLSDLYLMQNHLSGSIPDAIGNCRRLRLLDVSFNSLSGPIPDKLFGIASLTLLVDLSHNYLEGHLPANIGSLTNVENLYLSDNRYFGEIPSTLGDCQSLEILQLSHNFFWGSIPPSLGNLKGLRSLDLSLNNLSGSIPHSLGDLKLLSYLNLSFNALDQGVPQKGVFRNASAVSLVGNKKLCGGVPELRLPTCPSENHGKDRRSHLLLKVITPIAILVPCLLVLSLCLAAHVRGTFRKLEKRGTSVASWEDKYERISYNDLLKATEGFSSTNLIGMGSFGSVYKGSLEGGRRPIAVKVLNHERRGASRSFLAECEALKTVRHRNLVKVISVCSSVDFGGNDFKALVYEFMPNGSLDDWLHGHPTGLDFPRRLSIVSDVASALEYLHKDCPSPIVHCDLKPSNVLLDDDMNGRLSDFGLARILSQDGSSNGSQNPTSSIGIKGSIGYVAPEYGLGGCVTTHGDVYSFGVLLLEMFTARKPTHDMFKDGLSLREFVQMAIPGQIMKVIDPRLLSQDEDQEEEVLSHRHNRRPKPSKRGMLECLISIMRIGLLCTEESPRERMEMEDVVQELHKVEKLYVRAV